MMLYRVTTTLIFTRREPADYHINAVLDYLTTEVVPGTVSPDLNSPLVSLELADKEATNGPLWQLIKEWRTPT